MTVSINTEVAGGASADSSSSGGGAGGGGSDLTAATIGSNGIATYTAGAQWVIAYDGTGIPLYEYLSGDSVNLRSTLTDAGGGVYVVSSGLKHVSGALQMTLAQRATWTALTPTIDYGFLVYVSDVGTIIDASGNTITPGGYCRWAGTTLGWQWVSPVVYAAYQAGTTINFASGALATSRQLDIAGGVIGPYDQVFMGTAWNMTGANGLRRVQMNIGSLAIYDRNNIPAVAANSVAFVRTLNGVGVNSQIHSSLLTVEYDAPGYTGAALATSSVNTSSTVSVTGKATLVSGDTAVCRFLIAKVASESGTWG